MGFFSKKEKVKKVTRCPYCTMVIETTATRKVKCWNCGKKSKIK